MILPAQETLSEEYEAPLHHREQPSIHLRPPFQISLPVTLESQVHLVQRILQTIIDQQMIAFPLHPSLEGDIPLPIGDFTQEPTHPLILAMPYRRMMFSYITRYHPDHPRGQCLTPLDFRLMKGLVAQLFLLLRKIILMLQEHPSAFEEQELPETLTIYLHFVRNMLLLDHWQSMLTVLMPSLVQPGCLSAWTQVSRILQSTLSEMTEWVLMSKSVSNHRMSPLRRNETNGNHHWKPSELFISKLTSIGGSIWKTPDGYRIQIPVNAWKEYRLNSSSIPYN